MTSNVYTAPNIPTRHRPIYDGLETDEELMAAAMKEYELLKEPDEDGLDFANKTCMWVAFERHIESQRDDGLFRDPLAKFFSEPYGQRLSDSMAFGLKIGCFDPADANIGLGLEGHVMYTAARTKLINDYMEKWISFKSTKPAGQVVNVGAGVDTRPYWLSCLSQVKAYWEIDTASVIKYKQTILEGLTEQYKPTPLCPIHSISMDITTTSTSLADHLLRSGYDSSLPSCWILEGLIMYLKKRETVEQLIDSISELSASGSFIILNFSTNMPNTTSPSIDELDERLEGQQWKKVTRLMFGQEGFHYNRYPEGKPANKILGFAMYQKE